MFVRAETTYGRTGNANRIGQRGRGYRNGCRHQINRCSYFLPFGELTISQRQVTNIPNINA